jgi:hypothetical protein
VIANQVYRNSVSVECGRHLISLPQPFLHGVSTLLFGAQWDESETTAARFQITGASSGRCLYGLRLNGRVGNRERELILPASSQQEQQRCKRQYSARQRAHWDRPEPD